MLYRLFRNCVHIIEIKIVLIILKTEQIFRQCIITSKSILYYKKWMLRMIVINAYKKTNCIKTIQEEK